MCPQVPKGQTSLAHAEKLLDKAGVLVTPGTAYGQYGEDSYRLSLTVPDARLEEAFERMKKVV